MSEIRVGEGESLESALKRFKRKTARAGIMQEARKHEHYEKPSVRRKKKAEAAKKRKYWSRRLLEIFQQPFFIAFLGEAIARDGDARYEM